MLGWRPLPLGTRSYERNKGYEGHRSEQHFPIQALEPDANLPSSVVAAAAALLTAARGGLTAESMGVSSDAGQRCREALDVSERFP